MIASGYLQIRWAVSGELESKSADESKLSALVVNDMRLTSIHAGHQDAKGTFAGCFIQSEELCGSLIMHSVPLAKNAVKALKASTAALDLCQLSVDRSRH